jgi:thioredoxin 2
MKGDSVIVRCPGCGTRNRVPASRREQQQRCGKCKKPLDLSRLFPDSPVAVSDTTFRQEVVSFPGPVVVNFTAPW